MNPVRDVGPYKIRYLMILVGTFTIAASVTNAATIGDVEFLASPNPICDEISGAFVTVPLINIGNKAVTLNLQTVAGSAESSVDYNPINETVSLNAGNVKTFRVYLINGHPDETRENFFVAVKDGTLTEQIEVEIEEYCHVCPNNARISVTRVCDFRNDCSDKSDELGCGNCDVDEFRCLSGDCIPANQVCDCVSHCKNDDRPLDESSLICGYEESCNCRDGSTIQHADICNGYKRCDDISDEMGCGLCGVDEFRCLSGDCIPADQVCDCVSHCKNDDRPLDESFSNCGYGKSCNCSDGTGIRHYDICNSGKECDDFSDEIGCGSCGVDEFRCHSGNCIPLHQLCDCVSQCVNDGIHSADESWNICRNENKCTCTDGTNYYQVCNGSPQCNDGSDELNCGKCTTGQYMCENEAMCIDGNSEYLCDEVRDCEAIYDDYYRAAFCQNTNICFPGDFQCRASGGDCVSPDNVCDSYSDCYNDADEINCTMNKCKEFEFRCGDGKCIPSERVCDFKIDCADQSDEQFCDRHEGCMVNMTLAEGQVYHWTTPNYPQYYPHDTVCQLFVKTESESKKIRINFIDFDVERGFDGLLVYPGNSNPWVLSGSDNPVDIETGESSARLVFKSDSNVAKRGVSIQVTATEGQDSLDCLDYQFKCHSNENACHHYVFLCDGSEHCSDGSDEYGCTEECVKIYNLMPEDIFIVKSPLEAFNGPYLCSYILQSQDQHNINIDFHQLHESVYHSTKLNVSSDDNVIWRFRNDQLPLEPIISLGNILQINVSKEYISRTRNLYFALELSSVPLKSKVCGGVMKLTSKKIVINQRIPFFIPKSSQKCEFVFQAEKGKRVLINFHHYRSTFFQFKHEPSYCLEGKQTIPNYLRNTKAMISSKETLWIVYQLQKFMTHDKRGSLTLDFDVSSVSMQDVFYCKNSLEVITKDKLNNGFNDCPDQSDEELYESPKYVYLTDSQVFRLRKSMFVYDFKSKFGRANYFLWVFEVSVTSQIYMTFNDLILPCAQLSIGNGTQPCQDQLLIVRKGDIYDGDTSIPADIVSPTNTMWILLEILACGSVNNHDLYDLLMVIDVSQYVPKQYSSFCGNGFQIQTAYWRLCESKCGEDILLTPNTSYIYTTPILKYEEDAYCEWSFQSVTGTRIRLHIIDIILSKHDGGRLSLRHTRSRCSKGRNIYDSDEIVNTEILSPGNMLFIELLLSHSYVYISMEVNTDLRENESSYENDFQWIRGHNKYYCGGTIDVSPQKPDITLSLPAIDSVDICEWQIVNRHGNQIYLYLGNLVAFELDYYNYYWEIDPYVTNSGLFVSDTPLSESGPVFASFPRERKALDIISPSNSIWIILNVQYVVYGNTQVDIIISDKERDFYTCDNGYEVLPQYLICDGRVDCRDSSDEYNCATECGASNHPLTPGTSMMFHSPGYPNDYPANLTCRWDINGPPGTQITMTLEDINMESCCDRLIIGYGYEDSCGPDTFHEVFSGDSLESTQTMIIPGPSVRIIFLTDDGGSGRGFSLSVLGFHGYLKTFNVNATEIQIEWKSYQPDEPIVQYKITYGTGPSLNTSKATTLLVNVLQKMAIIYNLLQGTLYTVRADAEAKSGRMIAVGEIQVTTKKQYLKLISATTTEIQIEWTSYPVDEVITQYRIFYSIGPVLNENDPNTVFLNGTQRIAKLPNLLPGTLYTINVEAKTESGRLLDVGEIQVITDTDLPPRTTSVASLVGAAIGVIVPLVVIAVIVVLVRRRNNPPTNQTTNTLVTTERQNDTGDYEMPMTNLRYEVGVEDKVGKKAVVESTEIESDYEIPEHDPEPVYQDLDINSGNQA